MHELRCPACRRRFSLDSESVLCSRCGADLSLLMKMRRHAVRLTVEALAAPGISRELLRDAQRMVFSPEVELLLKALS